jgi:hypothetical protein
VGNSKNNNSSTPSSTDSPHDPSSFTKDPNLKNAFYGIAYKARLGHSALTDRIVQQNVLTYYRGPFWPGCSRNLTDTIVDMQILSQITTRIRLYNNYCNRTALVLEAIKQTKTNIKVFLAIDVIDKDDVGYQDQKAALQLGLHTYGADNILGIIVGNEFMFKYIVGHNSASVNDTVGLVASTILKARIADIRQMLRSMSITLPVGTADAASYFNSDLLSAVDFGCAFLSRTEIANV